MKEALICYIVPKSQGVARDHGAKALRAYSTRYLNLTKCREATPPGSNNNEMNPATSPRPIETVRSFILPDGEWNVTADGEFWPPDWMSNDIYIRQGNGILEIRDVKTEFQRFYYPS